MKRGVQGGLGERGDDTDGNRGDSPSTQRSRTSCGVEAMRGEERARLRWEAWKALTVFVPPLTCLFSSSNSLSCGSVILAYSASTCMFAITTGSCSTLHCCEVLSPKLTTDNHPDWQMNSAGTTYFPVTFSSHLTLLSRFRLKMPACCKHRLAHRRSLHDLRHGLLLLLLPLDAQPRLF